jgi:S-adenosylmethionine:tRNA ribosyltransferase-isomerase
MLQLHDFTYDLPPSLIAHTPLMERDASKLLVLDKSTGEIIHSNFRVLPSFLRKGDVLVRNNSKVLKARLFGHKLPTTGKVEILLNKLIKSSTDTCIWECISRPSIKVGQKLSFGDGKLIGKCISDDGSGYTRQVLFRVGLRDFYAHTEELGETPLPPYIEAQKALASVEKSKSETTENAQRVKPSNGIQSSKTDARSALAERYQTTYAQPLGSVAAPTAGLHFTPQLDNELRALGVEIHEVTLHVGLGTFLPVKTDDITKHHMHAEQFILSDETAAALNTAKHEGRRIIAVGTTTCRVLESCVELLATTDSPALHYQLKPQASETSIFIYPPYKFKFVDCLITNFHLPESTLLMLISALATSPNTSHSFTTFQASIIGKAYMEAIKYQYRFFSFGDSMFIR